MKSILTQYFWRLAVYDPSLLATCPKPEKRLALVTGVSLLALFMLILCSSFYLNLLLFNAYYLALIVGGLIAFTLINLYRFLLSSLLSYRFPEIRGQSIPYFPWAIRLSYLVCLVLIIAKPVELYVFKNQLEEDLISHRIKMESAFKLHISTQLGKERSNLENEFRKVELYLKEDPGNDFYNNRKNSLKERLQLLDNREKELLVSFIRQNEKATYFIPRLRFLFRRYPVSWLITLTTFLLFILPVFLEIKRKKISKYQLSCDDLDLTLILSHYQRFLGSYRAIFKQKFGATIDYVENYKNAPLNTIPKRSQPVIRDKDLLLKHLKK